MINKQIFLVDDDSDDQEIFCSAMEQVDSSIICHTAFNGIEALKKIDEKTVRPDIIFLDLNMPMINGLQLLERLRKKEAFEVLPVVIFSTASNPKIIEQAKQLGVYAFITKPDKFTELCAILKNIIDNIFINDPE